MRKRTLDNIAFKSYKMKKSKIELQELVDKDKEKVKQLEESKKKAMSSLINIDEEIEKRKKILLEMFHEKEIKIKELSTEFDLISQLGDSTFSGKDFKKRK